MDSVLAVLIAVAGWIATYQLMLRAQRRQFRDALLDRARMEVSREIHEYQQYLARLVAWINGSAMSVDMEARGMALDWTRRVDGLAEILAATWTPTMWATRLGEYDVLFPETRTVRAALVERQGVISSQTRTLEREVSVASFNVEASSPGRFVYNRRDAEAVSIRREAIASAQRADGLESLIWNQTALVEDLLLHLQSASLSHVFGRRPPTREPLNPSVPQLATGPHGQLLIIPAAQARELRPRVDVSVRDYRL